MMINGAVEIIAGVPGKHLDPLLLAQSQTTDSINLMVIAYGIPNPLVKEKFFDLLFLRGSNIYDCARMNQDIRFRLQVEKVIATFKLRSSDEGTMIHFYKASQELMEQFRSTFYYEPCLKIQLESLSKKSVQKLLSNSTCRHGIIERNDFAQSVPNIDLQEIRSSQDLISYIPTSMKGRLLLYDIDKNNELIQERYDSNANELPLQISKAPTQQQTLILKKEGADRIQSKQTEMINEANEFAELVKQMLNTPEQKQDTPGTLELEFPEMVIKSSDQNRSDVEANDKHQEQLPFKRHSRRTIKKQTDEPKDKKIEEKKESQSEIITLFERIFRSFRRVVYECLGEKGETIIAQAESQARLLHPDFSLSALTEANSIVILDVIESVIKNVTLLKRSRVRNAVVILVADAYNKQYDLLERTKALDRFEQFYYELKR
ncbi:MAG: hypothetical protein ABR936_08600 [Bacteroidota bacterium]|jgi:hypothetical protein